MWNHTVIHRHCWLRVSIYHSQETAFLTIFRLHKKTPVHQQRKTLKHLSNPTSITSSSRNTRRAIRPQEARPQKTNALTTQVRQTKQTQTPNRSQLTSANMASLSKQAGTGQRRGGGGDEPRPVVRKSSPPFSLPEPSLTGDVAWSGPARHNRGPKPANPPDKPVTPWN